MMIHRRFRSRLAIAVTAMLAGSLSMRATGQSVPGFIVETYATPPSPNLLAFGADGVLYAGRDDDPSGSITATFVSRITSDGEWSGIGQVPILDPDALVVDTTGAVSGIANSVLVGGLVTDLGPGRVTSIHPDGTVVTLFEAPAYGNISELKIDSSGRLLFVSFNMNMAFASESGATPTPLFATGSGPVYLTLAPDGRIVTSTASGTVRINAADGTLIDPAFAQFSGRASIEFAAGGGLGSDLLALERASGVLYRVSASGVATPIGSGMVGADDLAVGECGTLYVSLRLANNVLQIRRLPSPDLDGDGQVGPADLSQLLAAWGQCSGSCCPADLNEDGFVNSADLAALLAE
ncbi:MAG: hypothetical protein KDA25_04540, partial [Phycisphaerales bacterium]|nr:hypothetical protein [Phycisphaerales bacterium]